MKRKVPRKSAKPNRKHDPERGFDPEQIRWLQRRADAMGFRSIEDMKHGCLKIIGAVLDRHAGEGVPRVSIGECYLMSLVAAAMADHAELRRMALNFIELVAPWFKARQRPPDKERGWIENYATVYLEHLGERSGIKWNPEGGRAILEDDPDGRFDLSAPAFTVIELLVEAPGVEGQPKTWN